MNERKVTIADIRSRKATRNRETKRIVTVTAYDYPTAILAERAGVDIILVGDSGGMVTLGYPDTRPVTMDEMIYMSSSVARGAKKALLVGDMPFMSYQASIEDAIHNAGRFVKEGGMDAVKIEGGADFAPTVRALTKAGIPVMAHIGFTPQTTPTAQGYRVQGKTAAAAMSLVEDAGALEEAGAFSVVLEMTASEAAKAITRAVDIPTIGIGAGAACDGQVLVLHDILGLFDRFTPKFAKRYLNLSAEIQGAVESYAKEVASGAFPGEEHTFHMDPEEARKLLKGIKSKHLKKG
jgi:3-methyl-2-oxobutanoate hydroxymethyltransferase